MFINKDGIRAQSLNNTVVSQPWTLAGCGSGWPLNSEPGLQSNLVFAWGGVGRFPCDWCVFRSGKKTKINRVTYSWTYPYDRRLRVCLSAILPKITSILFVKLVALFLKAREHTHCTDVFAVATNVPLRCHFLPSQIPSSSDTRVVWQISSAWRIMSWVWDRNWGTETSTTSSSENRRGSWHPQPKASSSNTDSCQHVRPKEAANHLGGLTAASSLVNQSK